MVARSIPNSNTISSGTRSPYCARSPTGFQRSRQPEIEQKLYSKVGVPALDTSTKAKARSASPAKKHVADLRTEQLFSILGGHKDYANSEAKCLHANLQFGVPSCPFAAKNQLTRGLLETIVIVMLDSLSLWYPEPKPSRQCRQRISAAIKQYIVIDIVECFRRRDPGCIPIGEPDHLSFVCALNRADLVDQEI
jgi:hypothetical protein